MKLTIFKAKKKFDLKNFIDAKQAYEICRTTYMNKIKNMMKMEFTLNDSCEEIKYVWDTKYYQILENLTNTIHSTIQYGIIFKNESLRIFSQNNIYYKTQIDSIKMINLALMMNSIGCNFVLDNYEVLNHKSIAEISVILTRIREFNVKFKYFKLLNCNIIDKETEADSNSKLSSNILSFSALKHKKNSKLNFITDNILEVYSDYDDFVDE